MINRYLLFFLCLYAKSGYGQIRIKTDDLFEKHFEYKTLSPLQNHIFEGFIAEELPLVLDITPNYQYD